MKPVQAAVAAGKDFTNKPKKDKKNDLYETPWSMVHQLFELDTHLFHGSVLEPAAGKMSIVNAMMKFGKNSALITSYDLGDGELFGGTNFYDETRHFDTIITNPPFSQAVEFIQKARTVASQVVMLLPLDYLHGDGRYRTIFNGIRDYSLPQIHRVYAFTRKPNLRDEPREDGKYRTGAMAYAWYVWKMYKPGFHSGGAGLFWIDNSMWVDNTRRSEP